MYYTNPMVRNDDRFFPVVPFLVGALAGGAAVGISRPRPVVVTPYPQGGYYGYGYPYGYYQPGFRPYY